MRKCTTMIQSLGTSWSGGDGDMCPVVEKRKRGGPSPQDELGPVVSEAGIHDNRILPVTIAQPTLLHGASCNKPTLHDE
jgi:hypothetical protein